MVSSLVQNIGKNTSLLPKSYLQPLNSIMNFQFPTNIRSELQTARNMSKPQRFIYKTLLPFVCPEKFEALIRRCGFKHLFFRTEEAKENYLRRFLGNILEKLAKTTNKFGSLQVLKVLTNAICTPARFQKSAACPFCRLDRQGQEIVYSENEIFKFNHLLVCDAVSNLIRQSCSKASIKIINVCVLGTGGNLLISLLLGLPHFSNKQVEAAMECFALASIETIAIRYSQPSSVTELQQICKAFKH